MSIRIGPITLPLTSDQLLDTTDGYGAGAKLYLYSSATEAGSYSLVTTEVIVSGTETLYIVDSAGTTSTWYKARAGNSAGTDFGDYGPAFIGGGDSGYCSLLDVRETMALPDTSRDALLADMIADVSSDVDAGCGRQFYRLPQVTGTETFYLDVTRAGMSSLSLATGGRGCSDGRALDIISVTTLSVRTGQSDTYTAVAAGDSGYFLQSGDGPGVAGTDWPYGDIVLSSAAPYTVWPVGMRSVKVVGVRGFPAVPGPVRRAVASEVRERFRQSVGGGPAQAGVNQFGTPIFLTGDSPDMRRIMKPPYRRQSWASI